MYRLLPIIFVVIVAIGWFTNFDEKNADQGKFTPTVSTSQPVTNEQLAEEDKKLIAATIVKVTDGDTMKVKIDDKTETIRLLLVDTPETKHPDKPVQPFGPEASDFATKTLDGQKVKLEIDVSERDKYGRLLCYLWIGDKMFNELLLENGLARVAYVYAPNVKYVDRFREIQEMAQNNGVGIWSIENYAQEDGFHQEETESATVTSNPEPKKEEKPLEYDPKGPDRDCGDFTGHEAAQAFFIAAGGPTSDPHRLDGDSDGFACE